MDVSFQFLIQLILFVSGGICFALGREKSRHKQFYSDTPWLFPLGIFVWGDALILGPFWMIASLLFSFVSFMDMWRCIFIFFALRSAYEVIYWINHQVAQRQYHPPLFRRISWLSPNDAAILYQLLNMCQCVFYISLFMLSFWV
jgi:hypothetical protein